MRKLKALFSKYILQQQLAFVNSAFKTLTDSITKLEGRNSLVETLKILQTAQNFLSGESMTKCIVKLTNVLKKNPDLEFFKNKATIREGNIIEGFSFCPSNVPKVKYAPVMPDA